MYVCAFDTICTAFGPLGSFFLWFLFPPYFGFFFGHFFVFFVSSLSLFFFVHIFSRLLGKRLIRNFCQSKFHFALPALDFVCGRGTEEEITRYIRHYITSGTNKLHFRGGAALRHLAFLQDGLVTGLPRELQLVHVLALWGPSERGVHHTLLTHLSEQRAPIVKGVDGVAGLCVSEHREVANIGIRHKPKLRFFRPSLQSEDRAHSHRADEARVDPRELTHKVGHRVGVAEHDHIPGFERESLQ